MILAERIGAFAVVHLVLGVDATADSVAAPFRLLLRLFIVIAISSRCISIAFTTHCLQPHAQSDTIGQGTNERSCEANTTDLDDPLHANAQTHDHTYSDAVRRPFQTLKVSRFGEICSTRLIDFYWPRSPLFLARAAV